jgi:hypothetical protein
MLGAYGVAWSPRSSHFLKRVLFSTSQQIPDEGPPSMPPPNSVFDEHKDEIEHYEQMFGRERGRLAVSLDRLTNALVLVGQHGVYCTSQRNPMVPAMDLRMVVQELVHAKELTQSVMEELRRLKEKPVRNE